MHISLSGKVALVTGGSRGLGKSIVYALYEAGADVVFTYHTSHQETSEIVKELNNKDKPNSVKTFACNVAETKEAEQLIDQAINEFGKLDIVINNAGITQDNLLLRMQEEQWDSVIQTNLKSVYNITKPALRYLLKSESPSIINITSFVGIHGNAGQSNYAASKAGIIGLTKSIAKEMGRKNIRCNAIAPGFIDTDMTEKLASSQVEKYLENIPLKRFGTPQEIADLAVFLSSDKSSYITGQVISVCGGLN